MSYILRFKYPAFLFAVFILIAVEIAVRVFPIEYLLGPGKFLTDRRRSLVESPSPEFDYIIIGASKSLSLKGHVPTADEPYSMYNLSMPALGVRYFRFFLEKYFENRQHMPAAVVFAGDPGLFNDQSNKPFHDPKGVYSDTPDQTIPEYISSRVTRRIQYAAGSLESPASKNPEFDKMVWDAFAHRYLHLFSIFELASQFKGPERIFILKEALPNLYATYKYREALSYIFFTMKPSHFAKVDLPEICNSCEGVRSFACHPKYYRYRDNLRIESLLSKNSGGINLGDRLDPFERMGYQAIKADQIKGQMEMYKNPPDLTYLRELASYLNSKGVMLIISPVPSIDVYEQTLLHQMYLSGIKKIAEEYKNVKVISFKHPYIPSSNFVEQVHYECEGSQRINRDFSENVMPRILKAAPYARDDRKRSFDE